MLRVFVALGKQMPKNKAMIEDTQGVAKLLAKYNCTMVQGGARIGLMGEVLKEFQKYSDQLVLIVPEVHKTDLEGITNKENYVVEGEADRLKITINTCDLIVVLPGGTGTMAELGYYNETRKSGEHNARIVMINTKGFYNKLFKFINHQTKCGFMKKEHFMYDVVNNASQLEPILKQLIAEKQARLQAEELAKSKEESLKAKKTRTTTKEKTAVKSNTKKDVKKEKNKDLEKKAEQPKKVEKKPVKTEQPKKVEKKPVKDVGPKKAEKKVAKTTSNKKVEAPKTVSAPKTVTEKVKVAQPAKKPVAVKPKAAQPAKKVSTTKDTASKTKSSTVKKNATAKTAAKKSTVPSKKTVTSKTVVKK